MISSPSSQEPFWLKVSTLPAKLQAVTPQRAMDFNSESTSIWFYDGPTTTERANRLKEYRQKQRSESSQASSTGVSPSGEGGISTKPVGFRLSSFRACEESQGNRNELKAYSGEGGGVGDGEGASDGAAGQRAADWLGPKEKWHDLKSSNSSCSMSLPSERSDAPTLWGFGGAPLGWVLTHPGRPQHVIFFRRSPTENGRHMTRMVTNWHGEVEDSLWLGMCRYNKRIRRRNCAYTKVDVAEVRTRWESCQETALVWVEFEWDPTKGQYVQFVDGTQYRRLRRAGVDDVIGDLKMCGWQGLDDRCASEELANAKWLLLTEKFLSSGRWRALAIEEYHISNMVIRRWRCWSKKLLLRARSCWHMLANEDGYA